jgi:hypothetical protein
VPNLLLVSFFQKFFAKKHGDIATDEIGAGLYRDGNP